MDARRVILVGSGGSADEFDWSGSDRDVIAISSGLYAAPHPVTHFVAVDPARYYLGNVAALVGTIHVPETMYRKGRDPTTAKEPPDLGLMLTQMRTRVRWDPGWGDWDNVVTWTVEPGDDPGFLAGQPLQMAGVCNSMLFAVQVAARLRYREVLFVGCDFENGYAPKVLPVLRDWMPLAVDAGVLWTVSSERSRLSEFMPVEECAACSVP